VPFLASSGWGLWSQQGERLVMTCAGGRLDVHRLTVPGGAAEYYASVDGTAVPSQCTGAGIRFPGGIRLTAGQILVVQSPNSNGPM
jgi:hypothetical protein